MEEVRGRLVAPDQTFILGDGVGLRSLGELAIALALMPAKTFAMHVDGEKNNFADWVEFCAGSKDLAETLRLLNNQNDMAAEVRSNI